MSFGKDLEKSLLEAIEIAKGNIPVEECKEMAASTYYISKKEVAFERLERNRKRGAIIDDKAALTSYRDGKYGEETRTI